MRLSGNRNQFPSCGTAELGAVGLLWWLLCLLLFYRLYDSCALPGKYDSWFHLALFEEWKIRWSDWLSLSDGVYCMWPARGLVTFGEPSPLMAPVFWFCEWCWGNPIAGFYGFTALLFALNATAAYYLGKLLTGKVRAALWLAVMIGFNNFCFAQIDHQNAYFWGAALSGLATLYAYLKTKRQQYLMAFTVWSILQMYLSTTVFTYYFLIALLLVLSNLPSLLVEWKRMGQLLLSAGLVFLATVPVLQTYLFSGLLQEVYNPSAHAMAPYVSNLHPADWLRAAPGNLFVSADQTFRFSLLSQIRSAYPGIILILTFACGILLIRSSGIRTFSLLLFGVGFVLAVGAELDLGFVRLPMPMKWFYSGVGSDTFLRTPVRAWFICIGAMGILSMYWIQKLPLRWQGLLMAVYLMESIPFAYPVYPTVNLFPNARAIQVIQQTAGRNGLVLHLPSQLAFSAPDAQNFPDPLFSEYLYAVWQTRYRRNSVNGFNGLLPHSRVEADAQIQDAAVSRDLSKLPSVNCVVWHHEVAKAGWGKQEQEMLEGKIPVYRDEHIEVYALGLSR